MNISEKTVRDIIFIPDTIESGSKEITQSEFFSILEYCSINWHGLENWSRLDAETLENELDIFIGFVRLFEFAPKTAKGTVTKRVRNDLTYRKLVLHNLNHVFSEL